MCSPTKWDSGWRKVDWASDLENAVAAELERRAANVCHVCEVGAIDYVKGSANFLSTSIPMSICGIDFCNCLASLVG